ncbi:hypothetical protein ATE49_05155 [Elizabethkingia miricola]|uniref:Pyrroline-5-carboxylate reductase catalytic N-terminal domain-containing protein n=1 Tax=Elizabethkingia miricola TaxID=172045 RepID=A0ABY3NFZ0_ELIMR|nr:MULTISPECIES: NAD(P)-binding domain-containing protein [Elizabethkingia]OBS12609.1 hypothetical protein ATE49_05155 [Elizabethkingia miricola]TYO91905.1 hypothetical protein LX74_02156 [Elizabethkingia miricola]
MKKVAIVGMGALGKTIALNLVKNRQNIIVASKNIEDAISFSQKPETDGLAVAKEIRDAINEAEIIIPAIWFTGYKDFFAEYGQLLKDKIIIDVSNPIVPDGKGGFRRVIEDGESAGEINALGLPNGAKLAKALGSLTAESLQAKANQIPETILFYAIDDTSIQEDIEIVIRNNGFKPFYIGGIDQSIRMEVGGDLHEIHYPVS